MLAVPALPLLILTSIGCASVPSGIRRGQPGAVQEGNATYYADHFTGRRTANGERYDPRAFTAAHPALPFNTRVRVTRRDKPDLSVVVRINDRCPGGRKIIDLSRAAATQLKMLRAGRVPIRLVVLPRAP